MNAEEIRNAAMAKRTAQGLQLRLRSLMFTTMYPKDHATNTAWIAAARRRGYTILES
jgi:hypothetical protein